MEKIRESLWWVNMMCAFPEGPQAIKPNKSPPEHEVLFEVDG